MSLTSQSYLFRQQISGDTISQYKKTHSRCLLTKAQDCAFYSQVLLLLEQAGSAICSNRCSCRNSDLIGKSWEILSDEGKKAECRSNNQSPWQFFQQFNDFSPTVGPASDTEQIPIRDRMVKQGKDIDGL